MLSEASLCNANPTFVGLKKKKASYKPERILKWTVCPFEWFGMQTLQQINIFWKE